MMGKDYKSQMSGNISKQKYGITANHDAVLINSLPDRFSVSKPIVHLWKKTPLVLFSPYIDSWSYECLKGKVLCGKLLAQFSILHSDSIGRNYYWMLRVCVDLMKKWLLIKVITFSLSKAIKSCQHLSWQAEFCLLENDRKRKKTAS